MFKLLLLRGSTLLLCAATTLGACTSRPAAKTPATVAAAAVPAAPPAPAPLVLLPIELARVALVATMVAPTLERALNTGVALARAAAPLPLEAGAVREMALGELGIPPEVSRQLDLAAPVSGAVVGFGHADPIKAAFTFTVKEGVNFSKLLATLGTVIGRRGAAFEIDTPHNGHAWFLPMGRTILFAESELALVQAGNLALEARRASTDEVSIVVYPDAMARAAGTDVPTAIERMMGEIDARAASSGSKLGPEGRLQLREIVGMAADLATVEFALDLDAGKGIALLARLRPKAGTKLEELSRTVATIPIDPLLYGKADAGLAVTSAYAERTLDQLRRQRARLPVQAGQAGQAGKAGKAGKDVLAAARFMDALLDGLVGTISMVGRLHPTLSLEAAYPIKDAAGAAKIEAALLGADRAALTAMLSAQAAGTGMTFKVQTARKESVGKLRAAHWNLAMTMAGDTLGIAKKLIGPGGLDIYAAVVGGDRFIVAMGPSAKARLAAMSGTKAETKTATKTDSKTEAKKESPPAQIAQSALAEASALAGARSLYYYADLREVLGLATTLSGSGADPRLRMLSGALRVPIPVLGGAAGDAQGHVLTLDLTIPPSCIAGIGGLVSAILGAGGMPPGGGPPGASSMAAPHGH